MKTILFADNDADFLNTRTEFLEQAGYRVLKVCKLEEARQLLDKAHIHLAILDIRLEDDDDEKDVSGLTLAKDPAFRPVPKIMLTNFPSYQHVREALGPALDGLSPAVDFLAKQEGPEALIRAIERAFAQHIRINWDLIIQRAERELLSFPHLVSLIEPELPSEHLPDWAGELEDVLRCLFYKYRQIRIGRLLWHTGGRFCLSLLAQSLRGATDSRVLVVGKRDQVRRELSQVEELAPVTPQGIRLDSRTETVHFGAVTYVLPGTDVETLQPLRLLFQSGRERPLKKAFSHLLEEILPAWHQHGQGVEERVDLMLLYRRWMGLDKLSYAEVVSRVESLVQTTRSLSGVEIEWDGGVLTFHFPNLPSIACPDPVALVYAPLKQYNRPVVCRVSPGRLTADNILIDAGCRTWLTDFALAGLAPQWWDFVCLEACIRFDLSEAPDLLAWQEFEECLVRSATLADRLEIQEVIADLRTSVVLIEQIRWQAGSEVGLDPMPYYAGLLAWTVGAMARYEPARLYSQAEIMRGAHLLLAAGMLARRLGEPSPMSLPGGSLRLDEDGTVWIGDRRVSPLVGQELELLRCLYEHAGRPISRKMIVESVFGEQYTPGDANLESRINSLVKRLRDKIEPDPAREHYILTVKRTGYRLSKDGEW